MKQKKVKKEVKTHLLYPHHLPFLLIGVLLSFLTHLVEATYETIDIAFVSEAILMMLARGSIIRNVNFTVFAEITFFGDPIFAHWAGGRGVG